MTTPSLDRPGAPSRTYPLNCWYLTARSEQITTDLSAMHVADQSIVVMRSSTGAVHALADRGAHRPYPLSLGAVHDDLIVSGLDGWVYNLDGHCVHVPTQTPIPLDAQVRTYPVIDDDVFIWIWPGDPRLAERRRPPALDWLRYAEWTSGGGELVVAANHLLLLEMFADVTHVPYVDPSVAPPVLSSGPVPPLEVEISETSVSFARRFPAATLPPWHSAAIGVSPDAAFAHREVGTLITPAVWTDDWEVQNDSDNDNDNDNDNACYSLRFVQAVTPIDDRSSQLTWRVSRNFNLVDPTVTTSVTAAFANYYSRVATACEAMQGCLDADGPGTDVDVSADVAALQVRKILRALVNDESGRAPAKRMRQRHRPIRSH